MGMGMMNPQAPAFDAAAAFKQERQFILAAQHSWGLENVCIQLCFIQCCVYIWRISTLCVYDMHAISHIYTYVYTDIYIYIYICIYICYTM